MGGEMTYELTTRTPEETHDLGRQLGRRIQSGLTIRLNGDLGSGKTCFVQGLARGLEVPEGYDITSPTYALIHEYTGRIPLYHVDLYRLRGSMDAESIGLWELFDAQGVVAVEWEERLDKSDWPETGLRIELHIEADDKRRIQIIGYGLDSDNLIRETVENWNPR